MVSSAASGIRRRPIRSIGSRAPRSCARRIDIGARPAIEIPQPHNSGISRARSPRSYPNPMRPRHSAHLYMTPRRNFRLPDRQYAPLTTFPQKFEHQTIVPSTPHIPEPPLRRQVRQCSCVSFPSTHHDRPACRTTTSRSRASRPANEAHRGFHTSQIQRCRISIHRLKTRDTHDSAFAFGRSP